ncbi:NAD(+) synthase [Roseomonas sp. 18066]|uniref:NAD(+) synthase n=1 Tax=Roseomonas sp. 18066 TaxID=2681412 RepID=UPI0013591178|nr:NAD(+) synthase [Roseomonas sp. 18066]
MSFSSIYRHGFARVAACTTRISPAHPAANAAAILEAAREAHAAGAVSAVFPELNLSGYAIDDLLLQDTLLEAVEAALETLARDTATLRPLLLIGAPLRQQGRVYNCAVAMQAGRILGVVPKQFLPNYREFYERRHFASGTGTEGQAIRLAGQEAPFGPDLIFEASDLPGFALHAEICEDLWVPIPPSSVAALAGATVLANLSASNITVGKAETRRLLCQSQSARCLAAYLYAAAGPGESTTDLAWDGQVSIFENGAVLAESERFPSGAQLVLADIDLDLLRQERARQGTFDDNRRSFATPFRRVAFTLAPPAEDIGFQRPIERFPFVPADPARLHQDCYEAYNIQVAGLVQRVQATGNGRIVIGVSGGLDSTQALIVAAHAMDLMQRPRTEILAFTMPGFGTSDGTKKNAHALMAALGVTAQELDIRPASRQMLADLGHPFANGEPVYDVTFENVQAGLRTDYLFRAANRHGGMVLGTGDLSELALGWCTYGVGDQMSHYNVNGGVPKTLIQHLIRWVMGNGQFGDEVAAILESILNTEISPELIPAGAEGGAGLQSTEAKIGPYALQDFSLFYTLRYGFRPSKIAFLALQAWGDAARGSWPPGFPAQRQNEYDLPTIRRWMEVFLSRFFGFAQFKRSAMPNGPKVAAGGSLSPRGDWRAPSDGNAAAWLEELRRNVPEA